MFREIIFIFEIMLFKLGGCFEVSEVSGGKLDVIFTQV